MLEALKPKGHEQNDREARAALTEHPDIYTKVFQHEPLTPEEQEIVAKHENAMRFTNIPLDERWSLVGLPQPEKSNVAENKDN